ncbi:MAG TPA: 50S ribosomal protein L6 [Limnochordia bacterium]|nr:50S ribosomal protein L6 [Limnochordia bacterium]
MSRIGKLPVVVPSGVSVELDGNAVRVKGPKGELQRDLHPEMKIAHSDGQVSVARPSDSKMHRSLHGLTRTLVANMVEGVTKGYERTLVLSGVGYRAAVQGRKLVLTVGFSHPVEMELDPGITVEVPQPTRIIVKGIDKELVGQWAAKIRAVREPEPYQGKGIAYENERIRRKAGKAGKVK